MKTQMQKRVPVFFLLTIFLLLGGACSKDAPETVAETVKQDTAKQITENTEQQIAEAKDLGDSSDYEQVYDAANSLRLQAAALEYEWRFTESILQDAKKAFIGGEKDKAMQLVAKAHQQSELAIAQAKAEATAWEARVVK